MSPPTASLSLDLDNKWSYLKIHGDAGWESFPSFLDVAIPRALRFLADRELRITFFIVGQDAVRDENRAALQAVAAAGHEIGNHSFRHESWLHRYSERDLETEITAAEEAIEGATGKRPVGFRGPGYCFSPGVLKVLARRGYEYDASTFPSILGPLARAYYLMTSKMDAAEREKRKQLFGSFRDGFQPLRPYRWEAEGASLIEIPVTTMPLLKVPIHFSYVLYLSGWSSSLARLYFRTALGLCALTGIQPSLLLHPLDFLEGEDAPELLFFPGMKLPLAKKMAILGETVDLVCARYSVISVGEHARRARAGPRLPRRKPAS